MTQDSNSAASSQEAPRLPVHEWAAVVIIMGLLLGITAIVWWHGDSSIPTQVGPPHYIVDQEIEVYVEGAVEKPGPMLVKRGERLSEVLEKAVLMPDSDLRRLKLMKKVRSGQVIKVPHRPMISVMIEGAVETPGPVTLPKGSSVSDLIPLIKFQEGAQTEKLQRKRRLKDGEVITVELKELKKGKK